MKELPVKVGQTWRRRDGALVIVEAITERFGRSVVWVYKAGRSYGHGQCMLGRWLATYTLEKDVQGGDAS